MATLWADGLVLPTPTLLAGGSGVAATAPAPTLSSGSNGAALTAPTPTLSSISMDAAILTAPAPTLTSEMGDPTYPLTGGVSAPMPGLTANVFTGEVMTAANAAPMPAIEIGTKDVVLMAPMPQATITLLSGALITVDAVAPAPILSAELSNPAIITAANSAAMPQLAAAMAAGNVTTAALAARMPALSAQGLTGSVGTAVLEAATPIMAAAGYPAYTLTFTNTAPMPYLDATLISALAATYRTWALNLRKAPLTEYTNFPFNSYTVFNGVVIAAGTGGLVELGTQDSDAGTAIAAVATTGKESFASSLHKRIPRIYLGHSATGDMKFSTITTEGGTRAYSLPWNGLNGMQQRRVPVGKGPKSRYWQFSIENVAGADFKIADMLVNTTTLRRRVM